MLVGHPPSCCHPTKSRGQKGDSDVIVGGISTRQVLKTRCFHVCSIRNTSIARDAWSVSPSGWRCLDTTDDLGTLGVELGGVAFV